MLISPAIKEEIDYKIKRLGHIRDQERFDHFKDMVAIKILQERWLLHRSEPLFDTVKEIIKENGLIEKLEEMERLAGGLRNKAEELILENILDKAKIKGLPLFYSAEEFEGYEE